MKTTTIEFHVGLLFILLEQKVISEEQCIYMAEAIINGSQNFE